MNDETIKIYSGTSHLYAMGFRNALEEIGIANRELDKSDSALLGCLMKFRFMWMPRKQQQHWLYRSP